MTLGRVPGSPKSGWALVAVNLLAGRCKAGVDRRLAGLVAGGSKGCAVQRRCNAEPRTAGLRKPRGRQLGQRAKAGLRSVPQVARELLGSDGVTLVGVWTSAVHRWEGLAIQRRKGALALQ